MSKLKFVILKGVEGFGDRLQCLLEAISYAKTTKRILVVDWGDTSWSHDLDVNSDSFFKIGDVDQFSFEAFSIYFKNSSSNLSVYPSIWKNYMLDRDYEKFIYQKIFQVKSPGENIIWEIATWKKKDFDEEIVIIPGCGNRSYIYKEFSSIIFNKWITDKIKNFAIEKKLIFKSYNIIHLRAGSKQWANGHPGNNPQTKKSLEEKFPSLNKYLKVLHEDLKNKVNKKSSELPIFLLSDSDWLIEQWYNKFGIGENLKKLNTPNFDLKSGTHKLSKKELEKYNLGKVQMNYDLILDFHIMLNAKNVVYDGHSLFSAMASLIGVYQDSYLEFKF